MAYANIEAARAAATARDADGDLMIPAIFGALAIIQDDAGRCDLCEVAQPNTNYRLFDGCTHRPAALAEIIIQDKALAAAYGINGDA
jgi:hypothetical protein